MTLRLSSVTQYAAPPMLSRPLPRLQLEPAGNFVLDKISAHSSTIKLHKLIALFLSKKEKKMTMYRTSVYTSYSTPG